MAMSRIEWRERKKDWRERGSNTEKINATINKQKW